MSKQIDELNGGTALTAVADGDLLPVKDISDGVTKPVTVLNVVGDVLVNGAVGAINSTGDITTTELFFSDTSASGAPSFPVSVDGNATLYAHSTLGAIVAGKGSSNDVTITDRSGNTALSVPTGTTNISLASGNLIIGTSGKGIDFSATSDAGGMTSELLGDYEKGTFTPAVSDGSVAAGGYTAQTGNYLKVGDVVHFWLHVTISSKGSMTAGNQLHITGLPYTSGGNFCPVNCGFMNNCNFGAAGHSPVAMVQGSSTQIPLWLYDGTGGSSSLLVSEVGTTWDAYLSGSYYV